MKEKLILLTGIYRFDNLKLIAKIVNKYNKIWRSKLDIYWLICKDQYNGFGNLDDAIKYLETTDIMYEIIDSGKPNQKNYGGDLFNEPLKQYIEKYKLDNPWVYILDDDNIPHPNLFSCLYNCYKAGYYGGKEMISLNIKFDEGHVKLISKFSHNSLNECKFFDAMGIIDPSAIIMRYSIIKKYGGFSGDASYDFTWLFELSNIERKADNILYYHDHYAGLQVSAYHNHLMPIINTECIDKFKRFDIDNINIDINLTQITTAEDVENGTYSHWYSKDMVQPLDIPILTNESKKRILEIIYNEIKTVNEKDEL